VSAGAFDFRHGLTNLYSAIAKLARAAPAVATPADVNAARAGRSDAFARGAADLCALLRFGAVTWR